MMYADRIQNNAALWLCLIGTIALAAAVVEPVIQIWPW